MAELIFADGSRLSISEEQKQECGALRWIQEPEIESPVSAAGWAAVRAAADHQRYPDDVRSAEWFQLMRDAYALGNTKVLQVMVKSTSLSLVVDPELPEKAKVQVVKRKLPPILED